jgi:hypothetical protein
MQQGDLVVDILDRLLQLPSPAPGQRFDAAHPGPGRGEIRLRRFEGRPLHGDSVLKRLLVKFDEKIALAHSVVVIDQNAGNLSADTGATNVT